MADINEKVSAHIRSRLDHLLLMAFSEYTNCVEREFPDDTKGFAAAQTACRAALSHMILLKRFAEQFSQSADMSLPDRNFEADALVAEARAEIDKRCI